MSHHRGKKKIEDLEEIFTSEEDVYKTLNLLDQSIWSDENIIFFEPICGDGSYVIAIIEKRLNAFFKKAKRKERKKPHFYAIMKTLNNFWVIDINSRNIDDCRRRVWNKIWNFFIKHEKVNGLDSKKNRVFLAHVLCSIKWQIHENDMLSAIQDDPKVAKTKAEQTILSKKWFHKNGHHPIDLELPWTKYFKLLRANKATPIEFLRSLKFVDALKYGIKKETFKDFTFAHLKVD